MICMPVLGAPSRCLEVPITARMATWKLVYSVLLANVPVSEHNSKRGGVFLWRADNLTDRLWKSAKVVSPIFLG